MAYHIHVLADIPLGFSEPQSDRHHSVALQVDHSSPDHTLESHRERQSGQEAQCLSEQCLSNLIPSVRLFRFLSSTKPLQ